MNYTNFGSKAVCRKNNYQKVLTSLLLLLFLFLLLVQSSVLSQVNYSNNDAWKWVHPNPQGNVLRWCKMWNSNTWYMVGNGGTFMKTTDGGNSWNINTHSGVFISAYTDVQKAYFFNQSVGILACDRGLTKTTDGGMNFTLIAGTTTQGIWKALYFLNNNTGYAVGGFGPANVPKLTKTTDGGNTWVVNPYLTTGSYSDMYTPDGILLLLAGSDGNVKRSTDAGSTWSSISAGSANPLNTLNFINSDTGFTAGSSGHVSFTSNGGESWELRNTGIPQTTGYYDIDFRMEATSFYVYLTGYRDYIYRSSDYGNTWEMVIFKDPNLQIPDSRYLSTDLGNGDTLLTVGTSGLINRKVSPNGYFSYTSAARYGQANMYGIWAEGRNVWAVGQPTTSTSYDQIIFSSNAGESWSVQPTPNINDNIMLGVQMVNSSSGYVVGSSGTVLKTSNGGINWNLLSFPGINTLQNLKFIDINTGWVLGNTGEIYKTTDGGTSWTQHTVPGFNGDIKAMSMVNQNTGWIVGGNLTNGFLFKTVDGGENWTEQTPPLIPALFDIQMFDENTGYMCGNRSLKKTTNGGVNWVDIVNPFPTYQWQSLRFSSPLVGFVAAFGYTTIRTTDGGQNWLYSTMPAFFVNNISNSKIYALSPDTIYSANSGCGVLKYVTPVPIGITQWQNNVPEKYEFFQNYPNPFNPSTTIKFSIPRQSRVTLIVYDITGREIMTIFNDIEFSPGTVKHTFGGTELASGIYFYSLYADGDLIGTKKMVLIK